MIIHLLLFSLFTVVVRGYVIEGTIVPPTNAPSDWHIHTRVHVEGREHVGFVRPDGSFQVIGVPSGSYVVEAIHPTFLFQTARVDINSRGKMRARQVNAPQPNAVQELEYPLRLPFAGNAVYFKPREQLRTMDLLLNPSVLYVLVPFLIIMVLTKFVNTSDPEFKKELQQVNLQQQLPDMSELLSSVFGGRKKPITHGNRRRNDGEDANRQTRVSEEFGPGSSSGANRREKRRKM